MKSTEQTTTCAGCGENKHTPLRRDDMGGVAAPEHLKAIALAKRLSEAPTDAGKGGGK